MAERTHRVQRSASNASVHDAPAGEHGPSAEVGVKDAGVTNIQALMGAGGNQMMVQLAGGDGGTNGVHAAAAEGIKGSGGTMPHAGAIQQAFGSHDVGGIKAHTDGNAAAANDAMGAQAYASGNDVAFKGTPDLHTAAHEAAHIVQQRGGVSLSGGVGKVGDAYENHADAVADKVVRGESAEPLLSKMAGGGGGDAGVQKRAVQRQAGQKQAVQMDVGGSGGAPAPSGGGASASGATKSAPSSPTKAPTPSGPTTSSAPASAPGPSGPAPTSAAPGAAPTRPPKPTNDTEYMALAGWGAFSANVTGFGIGELALPAWKKAMDQLYTNEGEYERIKSDPAAMARWVDSDPARVGFQEMGALLLQKHPLDASKQYALWSGKPSEEYANTKGHEVLESTVLGELFNNVRLVFTEWNVMKTLWRSISHIYANEIGKIMSGKKITVFHRKEGEIFQQVESKALKEIGDKSGIPPLYEFHPLVVPGMFGHENSYEPSPTNQEWRKTLTAAAGGDAAKAKTAAEAETVRIFDHTATVPVSALVDKGPKGSESASNGVNTAHNATVLAGCQRAKKALESAAATATSAPASAPRPGRV